ncbi:ABC transporter substrate-binding protein [Ichthyenterobacterium sp. W332]|uniref:ABC transporter substrate-binding protein n=1 Tax=Microcosmobacter mediterraneus TaxID=3075607 RepID=A0ABU2YGL8_9FLAO|nr:ABC transporter substrate-binding protein [Ichthyenterobacterium sp. W332]MDT0557318.1 ABC transporter substrate-binding protein [Ichthyenterobacterium sp. W332]
MKDYFVFIIILCFLGCSNPNTIDNSLVFRYNEHKNISSLDPAFSKDNADIWATNQLFNGLLEMDNNLNVLPSIAKYYSVSEDALNYTFTLRNDVYFHKNERFGKDSTRQVIASDFEYSFNRLLDPKVASPGRWVLNKVQGFKAKNDSTFVITLKQPFPAFLGLLTMKYCSVVPKEIVEHFGSDFRANPVGTGPFKFKRWEENIKLVLRKNHNYFQKDKNGQSLPYLEAVAVTFLPDKQSEYLQFIQGNLDFLNSLDASYQDDLLTTKGSLRSKYVADIDVIRGPYLNTEYLAFYLDSELSVLQSELLRKAINHGFDRKKMMLYLRNGIGIPATGGFIPKGLPGFNAEIGYTYQPEKAKELISQFKAETGIYKPEITITTTSNYLNFCEFIQRELSKIGLGVSVDVIPASTLKSAKANGKLDIFRASWVADYPDAENYLSLFSSHNFAPSGPNYTHFKNATFDEWFDNSYLETNTSQREQLYTKMDSLVMSKAAIVPLYYDEVIRFTRKNVNGLGINPTNLLDLRYVKKSN